MSFSSGLIKIAFANAAINTLGVATGMALRTLGMKKADPSNAIVLNAESVAAHPEEAAQIQNALTEMRKTPEGLDALTKLSRKASSGKPLEISFGHEKTTNYSERIEFHDKNPLGRSNAYYGKAHINLNDVTTAKSGNANRSIDSVVAGVAFLAAGNNVRQETIDEMCDSNQRIERKMNKHDGLPTERISYRVAKTDIAFLDQKLPEASLANIQAANNYNATYHPDSAPLPTQVEQVASADAQKTWVPTSSALPKPAPSLR